MFHFDPGLSLDTDTGKFILTFFPLLLYLCAISSNSDLVVLCNLLMPFKRVGSPPTLP